MTATALAHWSSSASGITYPVRWGITLPGESMRLEAAAVLPQQEVRAERTVGFAYWEGACRFQVSVGSSSTGGEGYVELTGYPPPPPGR
jgi:predicted secreted hydrolase